MSIHDPSDLRRQLAAALSMDSGPGVPVGAPAVQVTGSVACEGFVRQPIRYGSPDGDVIPAYLAIPDGAGPFPAVVVFHQHAGQRHLGKSEVFGIAGDRWQAFGPALARRGWVVLAPDSVAFEDRRRTGTGREPRPADADEHYNELAYRLVTGDTLARKVLADAAIATSVLAAMPAVDAGRLGALGHSYGGNTVLFHAALDERIRYACASGAACTYRRKMTEGTGIEMAEVIPGFAAKFDIDDLVRAIAPRSLLVVSADADPYSADACGIVASARSQFAALGAAANLGHLRFPGGHPLNRASYQAIVDWVTAN